MIKTMRNFDPGISDDLFWEIYSLENLQALKSSSSSELESIIFSPLIDFGFGFLEKRNQKKKYHLLKETEKKTLFLSVNKPQTFRSDSFPCLLCFSEVVVRLMV